MEARGLMASTVARRLSALASFYRYCEQEGHVDRSPTTHVRRSKVDNESRTLGLDRNELSAFMIQAIPGVQCFRHSEVVQGEQLWWYPRASR